MLRLIEPTFYMEHMFWKLIHLNIKLVHTAVFKIICKFIECNWLSRHSKNQLPLLEMPTPLRILKYPEVSEKYGFIRLFISNIGPD